MPGDPSPHRLLALRHLADLSPAELAGRAGVSPAVIAEFKDGAATPDAEELARLADVLGCDADALRDRGGAPRDEYWSAVCGALPPLSEESCRAVGRIFREIDAARAARTATAPDDGGRPDAA